MNTIELATVKLRPGMRVVLPLGDVRTVSRVVPSGYVNARNVTIWNVDYAEGSTPEWSGGNTGASDTRWDVDATSL